MAITASDIVLLYTVKTGSAGYTTAGTAAGSLGLYASTTPMATGSGGLLPDITGAQNAASQVDFACIAVLNNHATLTLQNSVVYLSSEVAGGANCAIAVDNIAASAKGASSAQAATIASSTVAPSGVGAFSSPTTAGTGLALGDLAPGQVRCVWIRRSATNSAAIADGVGIGISGDTGP